MRMKTDSSENSKSSSTDDLSLAMKPPASRRKKLPYEQIHDPGITVVAILTRTLPICVYEPLGDVQAVAEESRYAKQFLSKMSSIEDPAERLCLLCGFIVSAYSGMTGRRHKPFNPLLGETYDYISEDGWRYHGEKVSFQPSITACHTEGSDWELFQALHGNYSFTSNSVSMTSILPVRLKLINGDEYSWNKVTTTIQNFRGEAHTRRVLNEGEILIKSNTGVEGRLIFRGEDNSVSGEVFRIQDEAVFCRLLGKWDKGLNKILPSNQVSKVFEAIPLNKYAANYYGFSDFSMTLNELHDYEHPYLPATDSRYRPDQRHLENSEPKLAEQLKKQLEQAQNKRVNLVHKNVWFHKEFDKFTEKSLWQSNKKYWSSKESRFQDDHSRQILQLFQKN